MKTDALSPQEILLNHSKDHAKDGSLRWFKKELGLLAQGALENWRPLEAKRVFEGAPFQVIDFFSGCGGMSLGFAALSLIHPFFELIGGCDIDRDACCSYERNFNVPCLEANVRSLENDAALTDFMMKLDQYREAKPLVAIGCTPCQGFTSHRKKTWEQDDQRNELIVAFARVVIRLHPECIILENVPEMLSHKYWPFFQQFRDILHAEGYTVHQSIYNAASFAVPQERFRVIVIAMKRDFLLPEPLIPQNEYVTVRQAIGNLPKLAAGERNADDALHRSTKHRPDTIKTIRAVPQNGGNRPLGVGPKCLDQIKGFSDVYGRLFWDKPAITVTHYARNPASGRYVHPEQDRGLTMREAARLQSFPDDFAFCGSVDSTFKQIGEAVPPKLACAIAASVLVELYSSTPNPEEKGKATASINDPVSNSFSSVIVKLKNAGLYK